MPLSTTAINAGADAFVDLADVGAGANPTLEVATSSAFTTILLTFDLDTPAAFTAAASGISTANGVPISTVASASGTATHKRLKDKDGTVIDGIDEIVDAIVDLIDVGAGTAVLEIATDSGFGTVLISYNLNANAFGNSSGGTATANGFPKTAAASGTGNGTHWQVKDRDGNVVDSQALAAPISFANGVNYTFNSFTYTTTAYSQALGSSFSVTLGESYNFNAGTYTQADS